MDWQLWKTKLTKCKCHPDKLRDQGNKEPNSKTSKSKAGLGLLGGPGGSLPFTLKVIISRCGGQKKQVRGYPKQLKWRAGVEEPPGASQLLQGPVLSLAGQDIFLLLPLQYTIIIYIISVLAFKVDFNIFLTHFKAKYNL